MRRKRRKRDTLLILDHAASVTLLRQRLTSRQWWAFVLVNGVGLSFISDLERRYFSGRAGRDFEMLAFPFVKGLGIVGIALARKRRLSLKELARLFDESGQPHQAEAIAKGQQDVILLAQSQEDAERTARWLLQLVGEPVETR